MVSSSGDSLGVYVSRESRSEKAIEDYDSAGVCMCGVLVCADRLFSASNVSGGKRSDVTR